MKDKPLRSLALGLMVLFFCGLGRAQASECYAVYEQTFSETRITDGSARSTTTKAKYLTIVKFHEGLSFHSFRTYQLVAKKYTLLDRFEHLSIGKLLNQGTKQVLVAYLDELPPTGRHFSYHFGQCKSTLLSPQASPVLLPPVFTTKGVGVPTDSDPNYKEYTVTSVLNLPATKSVYETQPADDSAADLAVQAYFKNKGFTFTIP